MIQSSRSILIIVLFAFIASIGMHSVMVVILSRNFAGAAVSDLGIMRTVCYTLASAGLLSGIYWSLVRMPASSTMQQFQTDTILALAFSEVACVAGLLLFFLSHKSAEFWPFAIAAVVVDAVFILPRVLLRA